MAPTAAQSQLHLQAVYGIWSLRERDLGIRTLRNCLRTRQRVQEILVALVVVCLQNSQEVSVEVLFARFDAPLIVMLAVFVLVGVLIGYIGPVWRRHRREEGRAGEELERP